VRWRAVVLGPQNPGCINGSKFTSRTLEALSRAGVPAAPRAQAPARKLRALRALVLSAPSRLAIARHCGTHTPVSLTACRGNLERGNAFPTEALCMRRGNETALGLNQARMAAVWRSRGPGMGRSSGAVE